MTFGFQAQRMDANERERTYGSLATFAFSNSQTAGFTAAGTLNAATGNAYASFLLGDLNAANVIEDSQVATSGRFRTYAFWVQDDFKVNARLALNLGLRYDIMKPYTEVYDRWSFMNPDLPNPAVGGYPGAMQFAGFGDNSCQCKTPIKTYYGDVGPRLGAAYSLNDRTVLRGSYGIMYSRRGAVGGRAGARNGTGTLGLSANASFPSTQRLRAGLQLEQRRAGVSRSRRSSIRRSTPASSPARPSGGGVTYGDPEIGGRPPRYQNWNIGTQYALTSTITVGAAYAGSHGDFLGGSGRGIYANQLDPRYLALGNLLTQTANAANIAAARAIVPDVALPYANFSGTIAPDAAAVPAVLRRDRRLRQRRQLELPLAPAHHGAAALARPDRQRQLHVQPHRGQPRRAHRLRLRAGLGGRRQRSAAHLQPDRGLRPAVREGGPAGQRQCLRRARWSAAGRCRGSRSSDRAGRSASIVGACNLPSAGTCYADFNPSFSGPVRINGDYGDGDVLGTTPPTYIDRNAFVSAPAFTYGNTPRTLAYDLRNPSSVNQDLSIQRDFVLHARLKLRPRRRDLQSLQHGGLRRHQHQHHQRQLRPGQLADQPAARGADQGPGRLLTGGCRDDRSCVD